MIRAGSTIVFKKGVTKEQAVAALSTIAHLIEFPDDISVPVFTPIQGRGPKKVDHYERRPYKVADAVREFESDHSWPTFYLP